MALMVLIPFPKKETKNVKTKVSVVKQTNKYYVRRICVSFIFDHNLIIFVHFSGNTCGFRSKESFCAIFISPQFFVFLNTRFFFWLKMTCEGAFPNHANPTVNINF